MSLSSGLQRRVDYRVETKVSEKHIASFFRATDSMFPRNVVSALKSTRRYVAAQKSNIDKIKYLQYF
jgi:hypothetical protein